MENNNVPAPEKSTGISNGLIVGLLVAIVALFILSLGFQWYFYSRIPSFGMPVAMMDDEEHEEMEEAMDAMMDDEDMMHEEEDEGSIFDYDDTLFSAGMQVVQTYVVSDRYTLVSTIEEGADPHLDRELTLWRVDTDTGSVTELEKISLSGAGVSYGFQESVMGMKHHEVVTRWEGSYSQIRHFFSDDGEIRVKTTAYKGHTVEVERGSEKLTIALSPTNPCQPEALGGEVVVDGVTVNDRLKPLTTPVQITCDTGYGGGFGWVRDEPDVTLSGNRLGFAFPDNVGYVEIDIGGSLNYDSVRLR